jgi:DnaJ-class molecular chaperone
MLLLQMPSHYEILGVAKNASDTEIKKAYRSASLKYHPDRNSSKDAITKIQEINEAYEILSDKEKKQKYDNELNGVRQNPFQHQMNTNFNHGFGDIDNIFNMMFNGRPVHPGMPNVHVFRDGNSTTRVFTSNSSMGPPPMMTKNVNISFEQSYSGCSIPIEIERWVQQDNNKKPEVEKLMVEIPEGVNNNETILLKGIGNQNQYGKGDIKIVININNTTNFKRQGLDLFCDKELSLKEALCGFSFEFIHLNGKKLSINNNNPITIIKEGQSQVFNGLGMKQNGRIGNLIFTFRINFPSKLTDAQREHLSDGLP